MKEQLWRYQAQVLYERRLESLLGQPVRAMGLMFPAVVLALVWAFAQRHIGSGEALAQGGDALWWQGAVPAGMALVAGGLLGLFEAGRQGAMWRRERALGVLITAVQWSEGRLLGMRSVIAATAMALVLDCWAWAAVPVGWLLLVLWSLLFCAGAQGLWLGAWLLRGTLAPVRALLAWGAFAGAQLALFWVDLGPLGLALQSLGHFGEGPGGMLAGAGSMLGVWLWSMGFLWAFGRWLRPVSAR